MALCRDPARASRHAAARRADQPPRRGERRLARAPPARVPGDDRRGDARSLLPRQRRGLDPGARSRRRASPGRGTIRRGSSRSGSASRARRRPSRRGSARWRASSSGCAPRRARARRSRKARLAAYEQLLAEESEKREDTIEISIPPGPRLGDLVVKAEKLKKAYGDNVLIEDLTFNLPRGGIVGVIGANGAGKTTLFRMIDRAGEAGRRHAAHRRRPSSWRTSTRAATRSTATRPRSTRSRRAAEILEIGKRKVPARAYVAGFNFKGTDQQKRVKDLSGGERNRVHLAKAAALGRQRAAARRADQRSGRRHAAGAGGRAARRSRAASSSSATIAGSWTASPPTSSRSRATARWSGSRATTRTTRPTAGGGWARPPISPTASATRSSFIETIDRRSRPAAGRVSIGMISYEELDRALAQVEGHAPRAAWSRGAERVRRGRRCRFAPRSWEAFPTRCRRSRANAPVRSTSTSSRPTTKPTSGRRPQARCALTRSHSSHTARAARSELRSRSGRPGRLLSRARIPGRRSTTSAISKKTSRKAGLLNIRSRPDRRARATSAKQSPLQSPPRWRGRRHRRASRAAPDRARCWTATGSPC